MNARSVPICLGLLGLTFAGAVNAQDLGDGTYRNYVIEADYPDPDVIRTDGDFFLVSSTNHLSPGLAVLHSRDLVNWRLLTHAIADTAVLSPQLAPDRMAGYGGGIWAPSLRKHEGKYFVHFGPGIWVTTADHPAGPWSPPRKMKSKVPMDRLIDCCPFWDDDGRAWMTAAKTGHWQDYRIYLFEMSPDGTELLDEGRLIHKGNVTEATKIFKRDGWYYVMYVEHPQQADRIQSIMRARSLDGPWEHRQLLVKGDPNTDRSPGQGGLVDTPDGRWFFLCHTNNGVNLGRFPLLLPVVWKDGWPVIGSDPDGDGIGEMTWTAPKPIAGEDPQFPQSSDTFDSGILGPQWAFNHSPRADRWSLSARPGFLRLTGSKPVGSGGFFGAPNTLVQRTMGFRAEATVRMELQGMTDGLHTGLCHFGRRSFTLGVVQENGIRRLRAARWAHGKDSARFDKHEDGPTITGNVIYLRTRTDGAKAVMSYSLDGKTFKEFGGEVEVARGHWLGNRVGVFCWNELADGSGYVDVDSWDYSLARQGGTELVRQPAL